MRVHPEAESSRDAVFSDPQSDILSWWCCSCINRRVCVLTAPESVVLSELKLLIDEQKDERVLKDMLQKVWKIVYGEPVPDDVSDDWKKLGFQSSNPTTDVRSGLFPMRQLVYLAESFPTETKQMVKDSTMKDFEYPFAACCFNVSYMITRFLGLHVNPGVDPAGLNKTASVKQLKNFVNSAGESQGILLLNKLFCFAVIRVHKAWIALNTRTLFHFRTPLRDALNAIEDCLDNKLDALSQLTVQL